MPDITTRGSKAEQKLFTQVQDHYSMAKADLEQRITRKNGFDDADKFFASYIDEANWPYSSLMFDPRPYTVILEKSARLIGSKPKGKLVPREGGDALGAMVNNELLSYQWDDNTRLGKSMIAKWIEMDQNARKYGSAFGICKWHYSKESDGKTYYDGPNFVPCNPRDVLANPSYDYLNKWFQHREWLTLDELKRTNDTAKAGPIYKNLDKLEEGLREDAKSKGDQRSTSYTTKNKTMRGLDDFLGQDEVYKVVEIITEYRCDRWITFSPRHGVILRDVKNPYKHGLIPVVHLKYYPLSDELYGVSEFEPVARIIRAINAHVSAYNDRIALRLRPPLHVNPTNVRMHTLEWVPDAKWLMNNPNEDVQVMKTDAGDDSSFQAVYSVLVSSLLNAWGESSQGTSQFDPFQQDKTATEVRDTAMTRNVRDNMNQIFLSEALKTQIMFWHSMNQQFMFTASNQQAKVIRIVGKDALDYFNRQGLGDVSPTQQETDMVATGQMTPDQILPGPKYPIGLPDGTTAPKFDVDPTGQGGTLYIEPGDLMGNYDYVPDVESMKSPSDQEVEQKLASILSVVTNPGIQQMLMAEGKRPKVADLLIKMFESTRVITDAEAYFEDVPLQQPTALPPGAAGPAAGVPNQGTNQPAGMAAPQGMAGGQNPPLMG